MNPTDVGNGTLRCAIGAAASGDVITFASDIAGLAVLLLAAAHFGAEHSLARESRELIRFRFYAPGAISLAVTALLFRAPFGRPIYAEEVAPESGDARPRAVRALALLGVTVGLLLPFAGLGLVWRWGFAEFGIGAALMVAAAAAIPVNPLPGYSVWRWNRWASAGTLAVAMSVHFLWELAILSTLVVSVAAVAGLLGFAAALIRPPRGTVGREPGEASAEGGLEASREDNPLSPRGSSRRRTPRNRRWRGSRWRGPRGGAVPDGETFAEPFDNCGPSGNFLTTVKAAPRLRV